MAGPEPRLRACAGTSKCAAIIRAMGKGDKRTRKGKIYKGSYGKKRPHRQPKKQQKKA
jgi:30S ribosomal protein S31